MTGDGAEYAAGRVGEAGADNVDDHNTQPCVQPDQVCKEQRQR
jgi:hypothetical protein